MKKHLLTAGIIAASLFAITAKNVDPVLMNVGGKNVPLSEFEYLYHKNNTQQSEPQSIDQYLGMFINYKLKVADAEAAGIDTTAAFRDEFVKFRNELAEPYLQDSTVYEKLVEEAYNHMGEEVLVSHIMLRQGQDQLIDSLRNVILNGESTFEDVAKNFSVDAPSATRGGLMGVVIPGRYPWPFEEMAYNTPKGELSPVVNSGFGLHIIRVEDRKPSKGQVKAAHILRLTRGMNDSLAAIQKTVIDSIYEVVAADPSKFEEIAKEKSEDPGSARQGGELGWFGSGQMVAEFDSVSFAMPVGAISKPFKTQFGWHIIKKEDARGIGSLEENREAIEKQIKNSERAKEPGKAFIKEAARRYADRLPAGSYSATGELTPEATELVLEMAREDLVNTNADYRNLVNEYRDGILLYEISNTNVWDKAAKDREGLEKFFQANKEKYQWDQPKFKGLVIFATNDSTLNEALKYAAAQPSTMTPAELVQSIREHFGKDIKVERVIAAKGENAITDFLGFGGEKPTNENTRWKCYAAFGGHIIEAPEEASDVRGAAVSDYQEMLENQWVSDLHNRYKVKVNKGVLKKVK